MYAYSDSNPIYKGLLKIGFTNIDATSRIAQQYPTARPGALPYKIEYTEDAMRNDGTSFTDHEVHKVLRKNGFINPNGEWFNCSVSDVKAAVFAVKNGNFNIESRNQTFKMRPEQEEAVNRTMEYLDKAKIDPMHKTPHFLWNAKMRFGKTFATYELAKKMGWKKILVLTFKPAVESAWEEDLLSHVDFEGWQFISRTGLSYENADHNKPIVCFGSFQDYLGRNSVGGIKA
ncbi:MAG: GIY-YIG nuclease family protein, partial [Clostridia bacterium]